MASPTPFAVNSYGVKSTPIDYADAGSPTTKSYHGGSIVVNNRIVGRINEWNPQGAYNREASLVYEVNNNTWGLPVDAVPGRATGFNVTFTRTEVWNQELELALGYGAIFNNLTDQNRPFVAQEFLFKGVVPYWIFSYFGSWLTEKNQASWTAEGDGKFTVSSAMLYVSRRRTG